MLNYLKLMLQLVLAPSRGWDDVAEAAPESRRILLAGLIPLCVLTGFSVGVSALWETHPQLSVIIIRSVITFAVYMLTYFIAQALLTALLPRISADGLVDRERVALFSAFCVGQMSVIGLLENLLPAELALLQFLPLFVVVVMAKARRFLGVDESKTGLMVAFEVVSVILPVYVIGEVLAPMAVR